MCVFLEHGSKPSKSQQHWSGVGPRKDMTNIFRRLLSPYFSLFSLDFNIFLFVSYGVLKFLICNNPLFSLPFFLTGREKEGGGKRHTSSLCLQDRREEEPVVALIALLTYWMLESREIVL
jgi:hypothetical protein